MMATQSAISPSAGKTVGSAFSSVVAMLRDDIQWGALLVALVSLMFLFWWDKVRRKEGPWRFLPGPLVVVVFGVAANAWFQHFMPALVIAPTHLVAVPVPATMAGYVDLLQMPDIGAIGQGEVRICSCHHRHRRQPRNSLLSVKAVDEIDPPARRDRQEPRTAGARPGWRCLLPAFWAACRCHLGDGAQPRPMSMRGQSQQSSTILHAVWLLVSVLMIPWISQS